MERNGENPISSPSKHFVLMSINAHVFPADRDRAHLPSSDMKEGQRQVTDGTKPCALQSQDFISTLLDLIKALERMNRTEFTMARQNSLLN